jgi:NAD(P)-dependent dehydrogenase (short-subunit alcohol dehydrogenase family)
VAVRDLVRHHVPRREREMQLFGKRALITGSSRGIGRGVALKLAEEGATIAIHFFRNKESAEVTLNQIRERGGSGCTIQGDVTNPSEVTSIVRNASEVMGGLDIFVNNARPELPDFYAPALNITIEQWDAAMNSQAKAFLIGTREAVDHMADGGRIVAVTYATGSRTGGLQPWIAMGSAKAALEATVRYLAVAYARRQITVNAISPSWTEDSVLNTLPPEGQDLIREWHQQGWNPMGRLGTPADVGNATALLCSREGAFITGQTLYVDGGASLMNPEVPSQLQLPPRS